MTRLKAISFAALCVTLFGFFALSENFPISNIILPEADARIVASLIGVDVGHCTDSLPCNVHVCADHVCTVGEWERMNQQMSDLQSKKAGNLTSSADGTIDTVDTFNIGSNMFTSFVQISYIGNLTANYIKISQIDNATTIHSAWISSDWSAAVTPAGVVFHSASSYLSNGKTINVMVVTQGKPVFRLDSISLQT
ncbi:MAG: hypothetical protein ACREBB_05960 [Nitrosotalea sp.]